MEEIVNHYENYVEDLKNLIDLSDLAIVENDNEVFKDCQKKIKYLFNEIKKI